MLLAMSIWATPIGDAEYWDLEQKEEDQVKHQAEDLVGVDRDAAGNVHLVDIVWRCRASGSCTEGRGSGMRGSL